MKKMKQVCLLLVLLVCLLLPATAFAADNPIALQLNGTALQFTDAAPVLEDGRVYVPFRAVFEALDAAVDYDLDTKAITAQKGDTMVQFVIGDTDITVNDKTVTTDAASFVRNGRTYVPVRFAAQSLGLTVGWDSKAQTVVMVDKAALKEGIKGQYTLMEKYMAYSREFSKEPLAVKGNIKFDMQVADGNGADAVMIPVNGTMTMDGISTAEVASMDMAVALDMSQLQAALEKAGELTAEDKAVLEQMKAFDMQVIANLQTGKVYIKSQLLALSDLDGDAWYVMDLNALGAASGMDMTALLASVSGSYESQMAAMIDALPASDAASCAMLLQTVSQYQDKNFQTSGNNYAATMKQEAEGTAVAMTLTLKTDGDKVTGYQQAMSMYMGTAPIMTMKADQTGKQSTMEMTMNMEGVMTMKMSGDMTYSATAEKPQAAPAAGESVIDLMQTLNSAA